MAEQFQPKSVKDVPKDLFIKAYAEHLKANDKLQLPAWVDIVKTSKSKELPPLDPDWYYVRAAAICRKVYERQGLGVGCLRKLFGKSNRSRGARPEHHCKAAGGVIRHILIQLESCGLVEKMDEELGGRKISSAGQRDMDLIACSVQFSFDPTLIALTL
eukprot:jgi/Ulvmu1/2153/UM129_0013.1